MSKVKLSRTATSAYLKQQLEAAKLREAELTREIQLGKDLSKALRENKSPCGHPEYFAYTEDGGKTVHCLLCAKQERDAALSGLEIARTAIETALRNTATYHNLCACYLCRSLRYTDDPSAALAERDRAIERGTRNSAAERCACLIDLLSCSENYAGTQFEKVLEDAAMVIRREFNLEPKPEGAAAFFGTWPGEETDKDLHDAAKEVL